MLIYGMGCYYMGWGVSTRDWMLVYIWDGVLAYWIRMESSYTGWSVSIQEGMLLYRMGCFFIFI